MKKELLQKYVEGTISDEEVNEVIAWLDADEDNVNEYMALHKLYNITLVNKVVPQVPIQKKKRMTLRTISIELAKIAAVVLIVLGISHLIPDNDVPTEQPISWQTLYVPAGQRAKLTLPDNTQVWVNAKSTLTFPDRFDKGKREVKLDGEAFFDVQSSAEHPFYVNTSKMNVVVTGTEFNVSAYTTSELFSVALLEGQVSLQSSDSDSILYRMNPNDYVELSDNQLYASTIKDPNYFRWRDGLICFNNERVGDMMKKLELYYDITINVQQKDLLQHNYTGKFRTKDGIEQVLTTLQMEHKFTFVKDNEKNCITIK